MKVRKCAEKKVPAIPEKKNDGKSCSTALFVAEINKHFEAVQRLLQRGATDSLENSAIVEEEEKKEAPKIQKLR